MRHDSIFVFCEFLGPYSFIDHMYQREYMFQSSYFRMLANRRKGLGCDITPYLRPADLSRPYPFPDHMLPILNTAVALEHEYPRVFTLILSASTYYTYSIRQLP